MSIQAIIAVTNALGSSINLLGARVNDLEKAPVQTNAQIDVGNIVSEAIKEVDVDSKVVSAIAKLKITETDIRRIVKEAVDKAFADSLASLPLEIASPAVSDGEAVVASEATVKPKRAPRPSRKRVPPPTELTLEATPSVEEPTS